uniref:Uncharacterized protein n=1 Tax=Arundo donax TaxID=35708 RepID=A0A0A9UH48_ARUDO
MDLLVLMLVKNGTQMMRLPTPMKKKK